MISITWFQKKVNNKIKIINCLVSSVIVGLLLALSIPLTSVSAANYGEGAYGTNVYSSTGSPSTGNQSTGTTGGGNLADTGQNVLLIVSGAAVCIGIGGTILLLKRRSKKQPK